MVNYVLSFCKITGASRIFSRNFYLPLLKPLTPKEALRTFRITGKWLLGAKIQHYIPVLLNHKKKRSKRLKNYGKKAHRDMEDYTYMTPVLDSENESHKLLTEILESKKTNGKKAFVYSVHDKKYNIVLQAQLERAILDGDVIDVLVSQRNDKIIVKLKSMKKIPIEIQYYEGDEKMYCGEGATCPEDEKFHHHGKYTMSLAKIFEDKEMIEEKWEEELRRIMRKRRRQAKEGSKAWQQMVKESIKNLDWKKFEEDAKKVIEEIDEPAIEKDIDMEIDDLTKTKNVNETILKKGPELLDQLPTMTEIPDIIRSMGNATLTEIEDDENDENLENQKGAKRRVSGVKVTLSSGKECFVSGQMVHTEEGDVFVPGQTVENEFGLEYAPGITINVDNKPTLISGLIMGEEERDPMFLPTQSTITAEGSLTFASVPEERPKPTPEKIEKLKKKKQAQQAIEEEVEQELEEPEIEIIIDDSSVTSEVSEDKSMDVSSIELNNSEIEEFDAEAYRLKQEQQRLEIEKLKAILMDDGLDDLVSSIEEKRAKLQQKLEEMRKLSVNTENNLVTYINESDCIEIASKITSEKETINRLSDILMTMTRRAATFRDKNSINADNINQAYISVSNLSEADIKFNNSRNKLKIMLKTAAVAASEVFKSRPKDQMMALGAIADIVSDIDENTLYEWLDLMNTPLDRIEVCNAIFKQLTQNITETKISFLNDIASNLSAYDVIDCVEKVLKKHAETKCEAFVKIARVEPEIINHLVKNVKESVTKVKTEEDAIDLLQSSIEEASKALMKASFARLKGDVSAFKEEAISFARALGMGKAEEDLSEAETFDEISDKRTLELLERVHLIRLLAEKDFSLKSALERLKKNPERGRSDPRIRQLIRESAVLCPTKGVTLRTSRDVPFHMLKSQNLLAIEDFLMQKNVEFPVLVSRDNMEAIIPKEASRGVLAGRVPYVLIDESGVTHMFSSGSASRRVSLVDDFISSGVRERSSEKDDERKYLQAKSNGTDGSWSSPRSRRTMSSGSLYRGYTGPRA